MRGIPSLRASMLGLILCTLIFAAGCRRLSGNYESTGSAVGLSINFKSSDTADVTMTGAGTQQVTYKVDGDKVTLHAPPGSASDLVFNINNDGSLTEPTLGMKLVKK